MPKKKLDKEIVRTHESLKRAISKNYESRVGVSPLLAWIILFDIGLFFWGAINSKWIATFGSLVFLVVCIWGHDR